MIHCGCSSSSSGTDRFRPAQAKAASAFHKEKVLATWQRPVCIGLLAPGTCFNDVVTDQAEQLADLDSGGCDTLHHCDREGTVGPFAIKRHLAVFGGEYHERCALDGDVAESTTRRTPRGGRPGRFCQRHRHWSDPCREWTVATGVEQNNPELP